MAPPISRKEVSVPVPVQRTVNRSPAPKAAPVAPAPSKGWQPKTAAAPQADPLFKAGRATAPVASDGPRDLTDPAARRDLATRASQTNPISEAAKNADRVCGGAAVVSALIMRSATPQSAQANARALSDAFNSTGAAKLLPASVNRDALQSAFDHFAAGKPTPGDVSLMQQAAYALGRKYAPEKDEGLSGGQLAAVVADLKARGATLGPETRFAQVHDGVAGHWVAQTPEALLNSAPKTGVQPKDLKTDSRVWSADVAVRADGQVDLRTRKLFEGKPAAWEGAGWKLTINPARSDSVSDLLQKGDHTKQLKDRMSELASTQPIDLN